jgi:peptidoglycan hydrolase CwlO-like protein
MDIIINDCVTSITDIHDIISFKKKTYRQIINLKEELREREEELKKAETYLLYNCDHNWVTDSIDNMNGQQCTIIKYCTECELTA